MIHSQILAYLNFVDLLILINLYMHLHRIVSHQFTSCQLWFVSYSLRVCVNQVGNGDVLSVIHTAMHTLVCRNFTFDGVNLEGAQRLARIARESGVEKFIHMSHLNAQPHPPSKYVKGGSKYLKSKVCQIFCYCKIHL